MTPFEAKQPKKKTQKHECLQKSPSISPSSPPHRHVFFLPRSCWLGCYRLGLEQQKSRRIDREMETDGFFVLHFTGTGRGCFFNQEKIDASAVRQDFLLNIHTEYRLGRIFLRTWLRRGFVVLWIVLLVLQKWNKTTGWTIPFQWISGCPKFMGFKHHPEGLEKCWWSTPF